MYTNSYNYVTLKLVSNLKQSKDNWKETEKKYNGKNDLALVLPPQDVLE